MKYVFSIVMSILIAFIIFMYGFKVGKLTAEKENSDKVIDATSTVKDDTEELKKEISDLKKKLKEIKNEECAYVLSYPVRSRCLQKR